MIHIIMGLKGSGKTKKMLDSLHETVNNATGDVVCIEHGKTLDFVDEKAYLGTLAAHVDGGVPVITMDMGELNDEKLGEMFYFFELCCGVSAYMLGVNPFNQPGVEFYKRNMFQLLGKPGYEK